MLSSVLANMAAGTTNGSGNKANKSSKKKKITKLIPSGAELEPIVEEESDRSEDSIFSGCDAEHMMPSSPPGKASKIISSPAPIPEETKADLDSSSQCSSGSGGNTSSSSSNKESSRSSHSSNSHSNSGSPVSSFHARTEATSQKTINPSTRAERSIKIDLDEPDEEGELPLPDALKEALNKVGDCGGASGGGGGNLHKCADADGEYDHETSTAEMTDEDDSSNCTSEDVVKKRDAQDSEPTGDNKKDAPPPPPPPASENPAAATNPTTTTTKSSESSEGNDQDDKDDDKTQVSGESKTEYENNAESREGMTEDDNNNVTVAIPVAANAVVEEDTQSTATADVRPESPADERRSQLQENQECSDSGDEQKQKEISKALRIVEDNNNNEGSSHSDTSGGADGPPPSRTEGGGDILAKQKQDASSPPPRLLTTPGGASLGNMLDEQRDLNSRNNNNGIMYDYDEETAATGAKDHEEDGLTWRLDPDESLSDWTILVTDRETNSMEAYHVHKNILAVGPRKSEYFLHLFRNGGAAGKNGNCGATAAGAAAAGSAFEHVVSRVDASCNVTNVTFDCVAARAMPVFLDFVYSRDETLNISTGSATGLRFIAKYFGVRVLHKRVMKFVRNDMNIHNVDVYYRDGEILRDEKVLAMAAKQCARQITKINAANPLLRIMKPDFFLRVVGAEEFDAAAHSNHLSTLLVDYCRAVDNSMDEETFLLLSDEKHMPVIHYNAALPLLEIEVDLVLPGAIVPFSGLSSLQKRCLSSLSQNWQKLTEIERGEITQICRKLPSAVVGELLCMSLSTAKQSLAESSSSKCLKGTGSDSSSEGDSNNSNGPSRKFTAASLSTAVAKTKKEYEAKMTAMKREFQSVITNYEEQLMNMKREFQDANGKLKREYEVNLVKLRDLCLEKDKRISHYWTQLKRFERLPNDHDGKIVASSGKNQPTHMPGPGGGNQPTTDGMLYITKIRAKKLPIFFFNPNTE